jgi:hypothetical protein
MRLPGARATNSNTEPPEPPGRAQEGERRRLPGACAARSNTEPPEPPKADARSQPEGRCEY